MREQAERALADAQATIHDLQTKLGHANLAQTELQTVARRDQAFVYHPGATPATYSVWARGFAVGAATQAVLESAR